MLASRKRPHHHATSRKHAHRPSISTPAGVALNRRQTLVLNRLLDGFEGKLTTSKYAKLAKCSQDTALRDIQPLLERGILIRNLEGGRSTNYAIAAPDQPG